MVITPVFVSNRIRNERIAIVSAKGISGTKGVCLPVRDLTKVGQAQVTNIRIYAVCFVLIEPKSGKLFVLHENRNRNKKRNYLIKSGKPMFGVFGANFAGHIYFNCGLFTVTICLSTFGRQ